MEEGKAIKAKSRTHKHTHTEGKSEGKIRGTPIYTEKEEE